MNKYNHHQEDAEAHLLALMDNILHWGGLAVVGGHIVTSLLILRNKISIKHNTTWIQAKLSISNQGDIRSQF